MKFPAILQPFPSQLCQYVQLAGYHPQLKVILYQEILGPLLPQLPWIIPRKPFRCWLETACRHQQPFYPGSLRSSGLDRQEGE